MKYFKPELLARCRSLDDNDADAAAAEWEQEITAYRARLRAIRPRLPGGARRLLSRGTLHDARLLTMAFGRQRPLFTLLLRLAGAPPQPGEVLELSYLLVTGPHGGVASRKHPNVQNGATGLGWILYDEFDLDEKHALFTHSLLLTSGHEIQIRFHNLRVRRLEEVFLSPHNLPEGEKTWPLVEA